MDYFNARHRSAALERFMQPDPNNAGADILNPQSWNGYAYVLGNPLGLVDPSGMYAEANTTDNDDDGFYQCCNFFFFPVSIVSRGGGGGGGKPKPPSGPSIKVAPPANNGPTFTKRFMPKGYYLSCGVNNQAFSAPMRFDIHTIEAAGRTNGLNPIAVNANVGHYGTFDYQRSRDAAWNTTFYSGYTNVSNLDVGVYMQSAGYSRTATRAIANGFALFKSSNFGDQLQALFRNLGYDTAAKGANPTCAIETYY